ncbi:unnamed protein product [Tilletia controversa]|nr:unnamed protein product [Tilletia controversa]
MLVDTDTQFVIDDGSEQQHQQQQQQRARLPLELNAQGVMRELDGSYASVQRAGSGSAFGRRSAGVEVDPFADGHAEGQAVSSAVSPLPAAVTNPFRNSRMTERSDGSGTESLRELMFDGTSPNNGGNQSGDRSMMSTRNRSSLLSTLSVAERVLALASLTESQRIQLSFYESNGGRLGPSSSSSSSAVGSGSTSAPSVGSGAGLRASMISQATVMPSSSQRLVQTQEEEGASPFGDEAEVEVGEKEGVTVDSHGAATMRTRMSTATGFESAMSHGMEG